MKIKPYDYQEIAIQNVVEGFKEADRGQLIMPCGSGKTFVSMWIYEKLNPNFCLVLVPSLALLRQTKNEWLNNLSNSPPYLCVCSEKTIDLEEDEIYLNESEIGINVTSEANHIFEFLKGNDRSIIFCTYHSLDKVIFAINSLDIEFDLVICDEAHKTAAPDKGYFTLAHDNEILPAKKRLYMTATPRVWDQTKKTRQMKEKLISVVDMSNSLIFGNEFYRMSFKEAIDRGLLVSYRIIAIGINDQMIKNFIEEKKFYDKNTTLQELVNNYALDLFINKYNPEHTISFHSSIKKAKEFQNRHINIFNFDKIYHVNSTLTTGMRKEIVDQFISTRNSVITNSRCLTEGVDIPNVDSIYFCDPKQSRVDIVQAIGRALRLSNENQNKIANIVIPIYHSKSNDIESKIMNSRFKTITQVLRALSSHDENISDSIRNIKSYNKRHHFKSEDIGIEILGEHDTKNLNNILFDQIINNYMIPFKDFHMAREFVHTLDLKSFRDWKEYISKGKKPIDIPSNPDNMYKNKGWTNWRDWLGVQNNARYLDYDRAKSYIGKSLVVKSRDHWRQLVEERKIPYNLPDFPEKYYRNYGWISWSNFLGKEERMFEYNYWHFEASREFVRKLKFKKRREYLEFVNSDSRPIQLPKYPFDIYKERGWISWNDFLIEPGSFREFEDARKYVHKLKLKSRSAWIKYKINRPRDIPSTPECYYKNRGWVSWGDWLGNGNVATREKQFLDFDEARKFICELKLSSKKPAKLKLDFKIDSTRSWLCYCQSGEKPDNIPSSPDKTYKGKGWISWNHWLGKEK